MVHGLVGRDGAERSLVPAELCLRPDHRAEDRVALLLEPGGPRDRRRPGPRVVGSHVVEDIGHVVRDVALPRGGQLHGDPEGGISGAGVRSSCRLMLVMACEVGL